MAKEETTLADIWQERDCAITCGPYTLRWNEDRLLGCWQIHEYRPKPANREFCIFEDIEESEAADKFLQLTGGLNAA